MHHEGISFVSALYFLGAGHRFQSQKIKSHSPNAKSMVSVSERQSNFADDRQAAQKGMLRLRTFMLRRIAYLVA